MAALPPEEAPVWSRLEQLPRQPGVYFFKNRQGKVIYVGKAKVLRNRVRSYFHGRPDSPKTANLVERIWDVETLVTRNEVEALLSEANFIKAYRPRFNVDLRDDKSFPYIRITNEDFPQVFVTRKVIKDGSIYYGPYTNVKDLRAALRVLRRIFPVRSCRYRLDDATIAARKIPLCLDYHIKKCEGPCQGLVDREHYARVIQGVQDFLRGRTERVEAYLEERMRQAAAELAFEDAARYRDQLQAVRQYAQRQRLKTSDFHDRDVIGVAVREALACATVIRIRGGKLLGKERFRFTKAAEAPIPALLSRLLTGLYEQGMNIPPEIVLPTEPEDEEMLQAWLKELRGKAIKFHVPRRGEKKELLELATHNAELFLKEWTGEEEQKATRIPKLVQALQEELQLPGPPRRIEGFDISHLGGTETVASMVCFIDGKAARKEYRRYKIKQTSGGDDFAAMEEVVYRRYRRVKEEGLPEPDLILIDGGKGQLAAAGKALARIGMEHLPRVGLAKRLEEIFRPDHDESLLLPRTSPALILLQRVRNEAHRFALSFQRRRRKITLQHSVLEDIPGLGPQRQRLLMQHFQSVARLKKAPVEEIAALPGISRTLAERIKNTLETV